MFCVYVLCRFVFRLGFILLILPMVNEGIHLDLDTWIILPMVLAIISHFKYQLFRSRASDNNNSSNKATHSDEHAIFSSSNLLLINN